jgi:hypothetical protein
MKRFLKENTTEIIATGIILIGIFLVVEQFQIRHVILSTVNNVVNPILSGLEKIITSVSGREAALTTTDALGIFLILLAAGFIVFRIRYRFRTDKRWGTELCPKCSSPIRREHRSGWDRLLGATFLPEARRYRCVDTQCGWSGLRRRHIHHHRHHAEDVSETENP